MIPNPRLKINGALMKQLTMRATTFLTAIIFAVSVSAGAIAQELTQSEKEKRELDNLYTMIISVEFCADLHMLLNANDVKSLKESSIERTRQFNLSETEKNDLWASAVKSMEGALFFINLGTYSEKFDYCSTVHGFSRVFSPANNSGDGNSSQRPF